MHRGFAIRAFVFCLVVVIGFVLTACNSSTSPTTGQISMTSKYSTATLSAQPAKAVGAQSALAVDSIHITGARLVLSRIKFEKGSDSAEFKAAPFVFEPNLGGVLQDVSVGGVPFGTYGKVKFKIHHIDSSDVRGLPPSELAQFADFLAGQRYSIIIDGVVYQPGMSPQTFTFKSQVDAEQEYILLPPLAVSESKPSVNVTLTVSSFGWFKDTGGVLLDPTDPSNVSRIDESLKASIKIYKDDDKDGVQDAN